MLSKKNNAYYIVILVLNPSGNPIKYHPIINNIHVAAIIKKYGVIIWRDFLIVYGFSFLKLYIFKYPIYITNDANIGVNPLVIESPALITIWANCGDIFDCMNIGTTTGENIIHLLVGLVRNRFDTAINNSATSISGIPVRFILFNKDANHEATTKPILLLLNKAINWLVTNISINIDPAKENFFPAFSINCL